MKKVLLTTIVSLYVSYGLSCFAQEPEETDAAEAESTPPESVVEAGVSTASEAPEEKSEPAEKGSAAQPPAEELKVAEKKESAAVSVEKQASDESRPWPAYSTKGNVELGGSLEFYYQQTRLDWKDVTVDDIETDSYRVVFSPCLAYFLANAFSLGVGVSLSYEYRGETHDLSFLFYLAPSLVVRIGKSTFYFLTPVLGAAIDLTDLAEPQETIQGPLFHGGAVSGLAVAVARNVLVRMGPAVMFEIGRMSDGGDIKARKIIAGFSLGFSFYVPTEDSFKEAARKSRQSNG